MFVKLKEGIYVNRDKVSKVTTSVDKFTGALKINVFSESGIDYIEFEDHEKGKKLLNLILYNKNTAPVAKKEAEKKGK